MALQLSAGYQLKTPTAPVRWGFFLQNYNLFDLKNISMLKIKHKWVF